MQTAGGNLFDILLNNDIDFKSQISTGPSLIPITKYCLSLKSNNYFILFSAIKTSTYFNGDTLTNTTYGSSTLFIRTGVD